jgi:putative endonuclease
MDKQYYVYIMSNLNNTVLYIGVTNDLARRVEEHKTHDVAGFTDRYNVEKLVYYEVTDDVNSAIAREKQLKNWHRDWKYNLVREQNPFMSDLSEGF